MGNYPPSLPLQRYCSQCPHNVARACLPWQPHNIQSFDGYRVIFILASFIESHPDRVSQTFPKDLHYILRSAKSIQYPSQHPVPTHHQVVINWQLCYSFEVPQQNNVQSQGLQNVWVLWADVTINYWDLLIWPVGAEKFHSLGWNPMYGEPGRYQ